jgi:hypothetical protein
MEPVQRSSQQWEDLFKKRTVGRCFRCLASDHRVADYRDPLKCFRCYKSSHQARLCRSPPAPVAPPHRGTTTAPSSAMTPHRIIDVGRGRRGSPSKRVDRVATTAPYSTNMLATENEYHARGLIAIMVCEDPWLHLSRDEVQEAATSWLQVSCRGRQRDF